MGLFCLSVVLLFSLLRNSSGILVFPLFPLFSVLFRLDSCRVPKIRSRVKNGPVGRRNSSKDWAHRRTGRIFRALLPKRRKSIRRHHPSQTRAPRSLPWTSLLGRWILQPFPMEAVTHWRSHPIRMEKRRPGSGSVNKWVGGVRDPKWFRRDPL